MAPRDFPSSTSPTTTTHIRSNDEDDDLVSRSASITVTESPKNNIMAVPNTATTTATNHASQRNHKKNYRRSRRILCWLMAIVVVAVIFIVVENEAELQQADHLTTTTRSKGITGQQQHQNGDDEKRLGAMYGMGSTTSTSKTTGQSDISSHNNLFDKWNRETERNSRMDDDLFTFFTKSRSSSTNGNGKKKPKTKRTSSSSASTTTTLSAATTPLQKRKKKIQKKKLQPFPVIQYDDDTIPRGAAGSVIHAADALLCRDTVIDYVINATDLKDECDGLKKAFTKTCTDDAGSSSSSGVSRRQRRLTMGNKNDISTSSNPVLKWQHRLRRWSRYVKRLWTGTGGSQGTVIVVEDEVLDAWVDAATEVELGWDWHYQTDELQSILQWETEDDDEGDPVAETVVGPQQLPSRRELGELRRRQEHINQVVMKQGGDDSQTQIIRRTGNKDDETVSSTSSSSSSSSSSKTMPGQPVKNVTDATPLPAKDGTKNSNKHMMNLALPTTVKHVSEKMLSETLMLQQDNKLMKAVQNQTNHTVSEAQADAAASSKAVSDANDLVSSVFNDPTSVEARTCCTSILNVFHEICNVEPEEELSDSRLLVAVAVIAICGMVKSLIRHFSIRWLPEAAGCILVGMTAGYFLSFYPHHDISFDGKWFLRIMVPPIVFEAALSIDKRSFNRHVVPILIYAIIGTLIATAVTAVVLHEGSTYFRGLCETIPYPEALTFGALISSIDPIAVLSVLSNMGMTDTDTIYVVIFGESLLNDGVAIVLFQTVVHFLDDNMEVDRHAVAAAAIHFLVVFIGSFLIGVASGLCCTVYYWIMHGCQTPLVEVLMFCCWALLPYYVCDGIEWSGIVAVVAAGFVMDIFVVGTHLGHEGVFDQETFAGDGDVGLSESLSDVSEKDLKNRRRRNNQVRRPILSREGLLSKEAKTHIGFVTEIIATMMETAIFAYLGLFLFSTRYHWNFYHVFIAIAGCCISRAIMIPTLSLMANWITRINHYQRQRKGQRLPQQSTGPLDAEDKRAPGVIIVDRKMQLVLFFAGLRGAMSFALVEDIPLYDAVTGEGTRLKSELKAMTSAAIIFTVFVLGGGTYYMMEALGLAPQQSSDKTYNAVEREMEMMGLLSRSPSDPIYDKSEDSGDESPSSVAPDDDNTYNNGYSTTSHSAFDHASVAPRRNGRPGFFRRQRQPQEPQK